MGFLSFFDNLDKNSKFDIFKMKNSRTFLHRDNTKPYPSMTYTLQPNNFKMYLQKLCKFKLWNSSPSMDIFRCPGLNYPKLDFLHIKSENQRLFP